MTVISPDEYSTLQVSIKQLRAPYCRNVLWLDTGEEKWCLRCRAGTAYWMSALVDGSVP